MWEIEKMEVEGRDWLPEGEEEGNEFLLIEDKVEEPLALLDLLFKSSICFSSPSNLNFNLLISLSDSLIFSLSSDSISSFFSLCNFFDFLKVSMSFI